MAAVSASAAAEEFMAAVSASAAASSNTFSEQSLLDRFKNFLLAKNYEAAEKLLVSSELHQMFLTNECFTCIEWFLELEEFAIIVELVKMFSGYGIAGKYCELYQVIAMTWLGEPQGYFKIQELSKDQSYIKYAEDMRGYEDTQESTPVQDFFAALVLDFQCVQINSFLFVVLKKLHGGALEVGDVSALIGTEGAETALEDCIKLFADYMQPEQIGGLCRSLLNQIKYFRERGTLIPKADPSELDEKA